MDGPRLTFGKHRGKRLGDVPGHYLRWLLCECDRLDDPLRGQVRDELSRRGDRYVMAWEVLADLEERLTVRLATDEALSHQAAASACDHVLLACEETREHFDIGDGARLVVPRRVNVEPSAN